VIAHQGREARLAVGLAVGLARRGRFRFQDVDSSQGHRAFDPRAAVAVDTVRRDPAGVNRAPAPRVQVRRNPNPKAPDEEAALAHVDAVSALRTRAHKAQLQAMFEVRRQLTDAQWEELREDLHPGGSSDRRARGERRDS
jgi:hypothetical protein